MSTGAPYTMTPTTFNTDDEAITACKKACPSNTACTTKNDKGGDIPRGIFKKDAPSKTTSEKAAVKASTHPLCQHTFNKNTYDGATTALGHADWALEYLTGGNSPGEFCCENKKPGDYGVCHKTFWDDKLSDNAFYSKPGTTLGPGWKLDNTDASDVRTFINDGGDTAKVTKDGKRQQASWLDGWIGVNRDTCPKAYRKTCTWGN